MENNKKEGADLSRISWNQYFMELARLSAKRSKDPKTKVGACIVNPKNNQIISIGYNGLTYGMNDEEFSWKTDHENFLEDKNSYVVHAEANAILNSGNSDLEGAIVYVTMFPCNECAKLLAQKRISKVIYDENKFEMKPQGIVSKKILSAAGIEIERYNNET